MGLAFSRGLKDHGEGVDAVAQVGRLGAVVKDVAQVAAAAGAVDFGAGIEHFPIFLGADGVGEHGLPEAGPSGLTVVFVPRGKEGLITAGAVVEAFLFMAIVFVLIRRFCPLLTEDAILSRCENLPPLCFRLCYLKLFSGLRKD